MTEAEARSEIISAILSLDERKERKDGEERFFGPVDLSFSERKCEACAEKGDPRLMSRYFYYVFILCSVKEMN